LAGSTRDIVRSVDMRGLDVPDDVVNRFVPHHRVESIQDRRARLG
jgi:hypothetical protein